MGFREEFEKTYNINTSGGGQTKKKREESGKKTRINTENSGGDFRKQFEKRYGINTSGAGATREMRKASNSRMQFAQEYANRYGKSSENGTAQATGSSLSGAERFGKQIGSGSTRYGYIKNEPDYRAMVEKGKKDTHTFFGETGLLTMNPWKKYVDYMTPEQMDTYYYLQGKYGEGYGDDNKVVDYIESIQSDLDRQYADAKIKEARERGEKHPVLGVAQNAWESLQAAGGYPAAVLDQIIGREQDPNRDGLVNFRIAEAAGEGVKEAARNTFGDNAAVDFLTDTGLSIGQNIARLPFGAANLFLAGGSAATGGYLDAKERGVSDERALIGGAATGIAEGLFEKISLGNLESFKDVPIKGARDFARNVGRQMIVEGSEEMGTELANAITDKLIMGDKSNYDIAYRNYLSAGMSEEEARNSALMDIAQNIGLAGVGGAISGGIMGSGAGALNLVGRTRQGGRSQYNYQEIADAVSDNREDFLTDRTFNKGENLRKLAEEYAQMQTNGQEINNYDRGYFEDVLEDYARSARDDVWKADRKEARKQRRANWRNAIADRGRAITGEIAGESLVNQDQTGQVDDTVLKGTDQTAGAEDVQSAEKISMGKEIALGEQQENRIAGTRATTTSQNLTQEIEENSRPFGEKGREAYVDSYDGSVALEDYHRAFGRYYDAGRYNTPMEIADRAALTSLITTEQASAAYKAGMQDRNAAAKPQYIQGTARTGGLAQAAETATAQQKTVAENFGKKTGLKFVLTDDDMVYGGYDRTAGTVYVSVKSDNFLGTVSHELTHFIQDYDADLYKVYADTAVKALMNAKSVSYDDLVRQYTRTYEEQGQSLSREEIVDEIVADATGTFLNNEDFINEIARDSKNKSIGYKILDFINDMIDAIKSLISRKGIRKSAEGLQENLETLETARTLWVNALHDAGENYKSGQTIQETDGARYQLNEFGFDQYTEKQKENWEGSNIVFANTKQDILNFFHDYIEHRGPYKKLYLGEIGEELGKRIFEETKVQVTGYNVCLDSYFENSHSDQKKESARGQVAVTPEMVADLPEIIGKFDRVRLGKETRMGKPSLIFEKNIDGKRVAVEYVSDKRRQLTTQTMWANKNKGLAPTSNATSASETTSETARGTAPIGNSVTQVRNKVKFQMSEPVEEVGDLIAVHNVNEEKLEEALDLHGMPMPSIAIVRAGGPHEKYGDISVVFSKDTIDPERDSNNKIYGGDAWTVTRPDVDYQINEQQYDRMYKKLRDLQQKVENEFSGGISSFLNLVSQGETKLSEQDLIARGNKNYDLKAAYLEEQGKHITVETKLKDPEYDPTEADWYEQILDVYGINEDEAEKMKRISGRDFMDRYGMDKIRNLMADRYVSQGMGAEEAREKADNSKNFILFSHIRKALKYASRETEPEVYVKDLDQTYKKIDRQINQKDYKNWVADLVHGVIGKKGINKGVDPFRSDGTLKSFNQTHVEYNLENLVSQMRKRGGRNGEEGYGGINTVLAASTKGYKSLDEVRADKGRLRGMDDGAHTDLIEKAGNRLYELIDDIWESNGQKYSEEAVGEALQQAAKTKRTIASIRKIFTKEGYRLTDQQVRELQDLYRDLENIPTRYFEAKPERAVTFDEAVAVIIPNDINNQLRKKLEAEGVNLVEYDPGKEGDRASKLNSLKGVRFQLSNVDNQGNSLNEAQKDYFSDTAVKTDDGKLKVMYHGTPQGGYTIFKDGTYFTENQDYAEKYLNRSSGIYRRQAPENARPTLYKVYLNIEKPFDTRIPAVREIYENDFYNEYGGGGIQESGLPDWTDGIDLLDFIQENDLDFDGIVLDEGGYADFDGNPIKKGVSYVILNPNQAKRIDNGNPTNDPDIRYQMKDVDHQADVDGLIQENEQLRQMNDYLTQQLTITKDYQPRKEDISRVAGKILKDYESTYNRKTLENNLSRLYEYIRSADHVDGAEVSAAATDIAKAVLNKSERRNTELYDQYKNVLDQLRNTKIFIPAEDRPNLASEGGYQEFRRRNFGKIRFANDGISIDSLYQELSSQHPELFPNTITNPADQAIQLADVVEDLRPQVENPYKASMDEAAYILGQEIFDAYFDVRSLPPTKADRMAAEADRVRREYNRKMSQYKKDLTMKYNEALSEVRKENYERVKELQERAEKAKGQQREYYQKKIQDLRDTKNQALAAQQRRYQESLKNRRESREASNYRRQITKEVLQLKNWLLTPTDKKYIPDAVRGTVAEFLESIDFSSNRLNQYGQPTFQTNLWNDVKDIYAKIASQEGNLESGQGSLYMDVDPDMVAKLDSLTRKVRNIDRLADMNSNDLRDLRDVVLSMKRSIQDVNRLIANKNFQRVEDAAQGFMEQSAERRDKIERTGARQRLDDMLRNGMLDARTYFSRLGPAASTMYDSLRDGLDTKIRNTKIAQDYMQELLENQKVTQKELRRWSGRTATAQTFKVKGGEIKLTPAQVMSLYVLNKRSQARGHIYNPNGGIKQAPEVQKKKNKIGLTEAYISRTYKPVSVTPVDVDAITETLTPTQKAVADGIVKFFTTQTSEWGNEVTMKMYGYRKFNAPNYFPIVSDRNYIATRDGQAVNDISTLKNMGATKATVPHANNPIIIEDIFDVYTRQADRMGSYNAFVIPLSDLQKFYNYKAWAGGSVKEELQRVFGTAGQNYIHQLMVDINGSARQDKDISDIWMSNMKAAAVGGNLRVVIQQPTAYVRASAEISPKYLAEGLATAPTEKNWEKVKKYAPIAQWKDWGYFSVDTGKSMKNIFLGPENLIDRVKDISMAGAGKADSLAWTWLWGAVEAETKSRHKDLKPGSEAYYQHVGKRFSEIVDKTQVVDSVLHRTRIMKSKNSLTRMATSFMSEPMKSYDMLYEAIADAAVKKTGKARRRVVRVGTSWALSSVATALAAAVIDAFRDKDEDKEDKLRDRSYGEKYLNAVGENIFDNLNPLQFIPYVKELTSIISGYDPQRTELSWAVDLTQAGRNWYNYFRGESPYTIPYLISDSAKALSKLTGIPVENFMRVVENGSRALIDMLGAEDLKYQSKRLEKDIRSEKNTTEYVTLMMKELLKGNQDLADQIYEDLIETGVETDKIDESMKKLLKEDERIVDAAERRMESDLDGFNSIVDDMVNMGYPEDLVLSAVDSAINNIKKNQQEASGEVNEEEEEEEKEEEPGSRYSSQDLIYAVEEGNITSFNKVAKEMYDAYVKEGKTSGQARSNIKSAITRKYKPLYMDAENNAEKLKILNKLKYLKVNGQTLYSQKDFNSWFEESKETKK